LKSKILIVDDEKSIVDILSFNFKKEGYDVCTAYDGKEALEKVYVYDPDLILLDIMMPQMDGLQVCRKIREKMNTPIIMLTARAEEVDKVLGLELGADDYVTKPFGMRELMARVKANLRRSNHMGEEEAYVHNGKMIRHENLIIDLDRYEVTKDGEILELTLREYELLKFLASQKGQIFSQYVDVSGLPVMTEPDNPNGSMFAIEGMTDPTGRVLGKMGHSERPLGTASGPLFSNIPGDTCQNIFTAGVAYWQ